MELPRNVELARELLLESGPMGPAELQEALARRSARLTRDLVEALPDRHPDCFVATSNGKIALLSVSTIEGGDDEEARGVDRWWLNVVPPDPLAHDEVVVLDIETTGLDLEDHDLLQVGLVALDGSETHEFSVGSERGASSTREALDAVSELLSSFEAIAGHNVIRFDIPFLQRKAQQCGHIGIPDLPLLDLHSLSVLANPTLTNRSLADLAEEAGIRQARPHDAVDDAEVTRALIHHFLDAIDLDDPNWALASLLLAGGGEPWSRLVGVPRAQIALDDALVPLSDPLVAPLEGDQPNRAIAAVDTGFRTLRAEEPGFVPRAGQTQMAREVAAAIDDGSNLAVEAPTGTGKTLAYLLPALASKPASPVVIATGTKVLQRQLREEAKRLRRRGLLTVPFRQVQGVSNYICTREVASGIEGGDAEGSEWLALAISVRALATATHGLWGDVSDQLILRNDLSYARRRRQLATTASSCERRSCAWYDSCPLYMRLGGVDRKPGIISANHALLASWARLADEGGSAPGDLLAERRSAIVVDEAHDLEESLTSAWTHSTGSQSLAVVLGALWGRRGPIRRAERAARSQDVGSEQLEKLRDIRSSYPDALERLGATVLEYLHEYAGSESSVELRPGIVAGRPEYSALRSAAFDVRHVLAAIQKEMISLSDAIRGALQKDDTEHADGEHKSAASQAVFRLSAAVEDLSEHKDLLKEVTELSEPHRFVHLLSQDQREDENIEWEFSRVPVDVGEEFREKLVRPSRAMILTSATLTVDGRFDFLAGRLGLLLADHAALRSRTDISESFQTMRVESPFDYDEQSAVVLTSHLPLPLPGFQRQYCEELAADQVGFLSLSRGRSLALFAARTRMEEVASHVRRYDRELAERDVRLLVQGEESPAQIQHAFLSEEGTVVYGLRSYWTGFDAPGKTLSYLLIEKPPYPHPSDVVIAARQRAIADAGGDPFMDYIVPKTAIAMAQGFGRLIRREDDRGAAVVLDRRLQQPTPANNVMLGTLPTTTELRTSSREETWQKTIEFVTGSRPDLDDAIDVGASEVDEILAELRLLPGEDPELKLQLAATKLFDVDALYPFQIELMKGILAGRDCLGFLPTGSGKSLCFQLTALLNPSGRPTVVVSPLVALIKDQVDELRSHRGLREVAGITGRTSIAERTEMIRDLAEGRIRLLYVSPERLIRDNNLRNSLEVADLGALVVDEAHCVSSWGHDFRPEFRQIAKAVRSFSPGSRVGLTATATPEVEDDISTTLQMNEPLIVRQPVDRPDLRWWVIQVGNDRKGDERERSRRLFQFVEEHGGEPGIVYASRRAITEEVAWLMRQAGLRARAYHAGLPPEQRTAIQEDFQAGTTEIIVATKAFGMGINKPDIGWVVHYDIPESLEAYAQEGGRAARSPGLAADCVLLWSTSDLARRRRLLRMSSPDEDVETARRALSFLAMAPTRGTDHVVSEEEFADSVSLEPEELNILIAWLERTGHLERQTDCTSRGHVTIGKREPEDPEERRLFVMFLQAELRARPDTRRFIDFDDLPDGAPPPDELERRLIDWSLRRLVTFQSTQRQWRIRLFRTALDEPAFAREVQEWRWLESRRFDAMANYATQRRCRRAAISAVFGDEDRTCREVDDALLCDVCSTDQPSWAGAEIEGSPDPERLVDVRLVMLQAVRWTSGQEGKQYGRTSLCAALLGKESLGEGKPIGNGLLSCPQFGALRFVRSNESRLESAISELLDSGAITEEVVSRGRRNYKSLSITQIGRTMLGGPRG